MNQALTEQLNKLLANTYALYLKTQNYHWHVKGPHFYHLHKFLEDQYEQLAEAVDEIAERIVSLGGQAAASFAELQSLSTFKAGNPKLSSQDMLADLLSDHQALALELHDLDKQLSEADETTLSLLSDRVAEHDKMIWMLSSSIEQ